MPANSHPDDPSATYEVDVIAWANHQAALLRAEHFHELDIEHIADETEDVGKRELGHPDAFGSG